MQVHLTLLIGIKFCPRYSQNPVSIRKYPIAGKRKSALNLLALCNRFWGSVQDPPMTKMQHTLHWVGKIAFQKLYHLISFSLTLHASLRLVVICRIERNNIGSMFLTKGMKIDPPTWNFTSLQENWTIYKKQVYPVFGTLNKMYDLSLDWQPVHLYMYHRNLLCFFATFENFPESPCHLLSKVHRWTIFISGLLLQKKILTDAKMSFQTYWPGWGEVIQ